MFLIGFPHDLTGFLKKPPNIKATPEFELQLKTLRLNCN